jgi:multidrug efflux pump subunit AcrB
MNTIISHVAPRIFPSRGSVDRGDQSLLLRGGVDYDSINSLKDIPIALKSNAIIHLSDVADVYKSTKDAETISRYNGEDNVTIGIKKRQSADTLDVTKAVVKTMEQLNRQNLGVSMAVIDDSGEQIMETVSSVITTLLTPCCSV